MLARAPDGGHPSHNAVMSLSTPTGLLRFISSTARCLGVPNATRVLSTLISNGPSRPNSRRLSTMVAYHPSRVPTMRHLPVIVIPSPRIRYESRARDSVLLPVRDEPPLMLKCLARQGDH